MQSNASAGPWPPLDRIMAGISPAPLMPRLVRTTRRIAERRKAPWIALYVETPAHDRLSDDEKTQINRALTLAEEFGAEVVSVAGSSVPRSEEHTSELQSLMRISYAVFCLKKKIQHSTIVSIL